MDDGGGYIHMGDILAHTCLGRRGLRNAVRESWSAIVVGVSFSLERLRLLAVHHPFEIQLDRDGGAQDHTR